MPMFPESVDLNAAVRGYIEALLWSESCNGTDTDCEHTTDDPMDCDRSLSDHFRPDDLTDDAQRQILTDVADFLTANEADVADLDPEKVGHDFLLTRNGHGTGFWDRGLGERGERLTVACKPYGEVCAYADAYGKIHIS